MLNTLVLKIDVKIIASVIYYAMMDNITLLVLPKKQVKEISSSYEPISDKVFTRDDLTILFNNEQEFYEKEWRDKMSEWINKLEKLISSMSKNDK